MRKLGQDALAIKRAEQSFDRKRRTVGLFGAPLLALLIFMTPIDALTLEAHKLLSIGRFRLMRKNQRTKG